MRTSNWHKRTALAPVAIVCLFLMGAAPAAPSQTGSQGVLGVLAIITAGCVLLLFLFCLRAHGMRKRQATLERLAYVDKLTGLRNLNKLTLDIGHVLTAHEGADYAIWAFSVKQYNAVTDVFGMEAGGEMLRDIGQLLKEDEQPDCFAGRSMTNLFMGLRPGGRTQMERWFKHLCTVLADKQIKLDISMGIYYPQEVPADIPALEMLNRAVIAQKAAEARDGSSLVVFDTDMREAIRWNTQLEADAPHALENGEFLLFLQPKVAITGEYKVTGAEALVRWQHPRHGMLAPGRFIPLFEKNGFVVELDRYVFEAACRWLVQARKRGCPPLRLAVNVSRKGLFRGDFLDFYRSVKERYGIEDGVLELEFTEGVVFNNYSYFEKTVRALQALGFKCSIDDFGSGYSSLNMLKSMPIDVVKLDAVFFRDTEDEGREHVVVEGFVNIATQLGIRTVAEGVETRRQVDFLRHVNCGIIVQGFYFSKPLPTEDFERFVTQNEVASRE